VAVLLPHLHRGGETIKLQSTTRASLSNVSTGKSQSFGIVASTPPSGRLRERSLGTMDDQTKKKSRRAKRVRDPSQSPRKKTTSASALVADVSTKPARSKKKARVLASPSAPSDSFPAVLRVYKDEPKKNTIFDVESLSPRACELWRSPSAGLLSANYHRPAGVCRRLGVIQLELLVADDAFSKKTTQKSKKKKQKHVSAGEQDDSKIYNLLKDNNMSKNTMQWNKPPAPHLLTKTEVRKDVVAIYGEDYHRIPGNPTQASLILKLQNEWLTIVTAGRVVPEWNKSGEHVDRAAPTSCKRLLNLLKNEQLKDPNPEKQAVLYHGLEHIATDAVSILEAIVDLSAPSQALYGAPLLVAVPKIISIERTSHKSLKLSAKVHISIGVYANRLLFDVMTQKLQIVMAALDERSIMVLKGLSPPPSLPSDPYAEPVFASDPKGPTVHFDFDDASHDDDDDDDDYDDSFIDDNFIISSDDDDDESMDTSEGNISRKRSGSSKPTTKEFDDVGASDGTLDAFTPSGFLKLIENTGTDMKDYEAIEALLGDKLQVELMLHQKHALSFMYKMEHLENGINSLIWEERAFPEGGRYFYSPILGQLRLALGHSSEPVRGGILADEMGL
jgi:hypothetical protein